MKALAIGATGAVGKDLVQQLIEDSSVERVDIFVRREVKIPSAKLVAHVVDFDHPETWADQIQGLIRKGNDRFGETASIAVLKVFNAIGLLRTWTPMPTEAVAAAMIRLAKSGRKGVEIIESQDILKVQ